MYKIFKGYCRLCATNDCLNEDLLNPEIESPDLCQLIEKHFSLKIESNNHAPTTICDTCKEFLLRLIDFEQIVLRSQETFQCYELKQEIEILTQNKAVDEEENRLLTPMKLQIEKEPTCSRCKEVFDSKKTLKNHMKSCRKKLSCKFCGNEYNNRSELASHRKSSHSNVRGFICDECGKGFKTSRDLNRHKDFHRDDDDTPFACSICYKKFKSKLVVAMHEKRHADKRCTCTICGLELKTKNTLRGHMLLHSEEFQFKCIHCDKQFRHKKNLSVHLLTHSGLQPYTCGVCKKSFSLRFNLRTHQKKMHLEETTKYEQEGRPTIITNVVKKKFACGQREVKKELI